MPKIKNVSPFGDLDVPLLGRVIAAGETVDVTDAQAETLLQQPDNYKAVGPAAQKAKAKAAPRQRQKQAAAPAVEPNAEEVTNDDDAA